MNGLLFIQLIYNHMTDHLQEEWLASCLLKNRIYSLWFKVDILFTCRLQNQSACFSPIEVFQSNRCEDIVQGRFYLLTRCLKYTYTGQEPGDTSKFGREYD